MRVFTVLVVVFFLVSCDKVTPINYRLPYDGDKLVLLAFLTPQDGVEAFVSHTLPADRKDRSLNKIQAKVFLIENGVDIDTLIHVEDGYYRSSPDFVAQSNTNYSLRVEAVDYDILSTPEQKIHDAIYFDTVGVIQSPQSYLSTLFYRFTDSAIVGEGRVGYHMLATFYGENGDLLYKTSERIASFGFITNTDFVGGSYSNSFQFRKSYNVGNSVDPESIEIARIDVELIVYSEEIIRFMETIRYNEGNRLDPFTLPVPIHNNIINGVGLFGSYAYSVQSIEL